MTESGERATKLFDEARYEEAELLLHQLADEGSVFALLFLGFINEEGTVRPRDTKVARYFYEQAALTGDSEGYLRLGLLLHGEGDADGAGAALDKAERLLRAHPDEGTICTLLQLGVLYEEGEKRPRDVEKAKLYLSGAMRLGDAEACMRLGRLYFDEADWVSAQTAFEAGVATGSIGNMFWLGTTLLKRDFAANEEQGVEWLKRAAAHGHIFAQRRLIALRAEQSRSWAANALAIPKILALAIRGARQMLHDRRSEMLW